MQWRKISSSQQKVGYKYVTTKLFETPDGTTTEYTTWGRESDKTTGVIAITEDNKVVIARQYRQGPEAMYDELPGGGVEDGEDPESAAIRELTEETGYVPGSVKHIGTVYRDAYRNEPSSYFLAFGCKKTEEQDLDEHEYIEVVTITIEQLIRNAKEGRMSDGIAVLLAYDELIKITEGTND